MKIGFWNVNNNNHLIDLINDFVNDNQIDFLILFECKIGPLEILLKLNSKKSEFYFYQSNLSDFIVIFTRFSTNLLRDTKDESRISAKQYLSPVGPNINFVFLHFPSKLFYEGDDQDAQSSELKRFIDELEVETENSYTIVLGDFNMNPFQKGMIQSTGLHSTFDKKIALKGHRSIQKRNYKFFYNPMWSFFGEKGKGQVHGTYYYSTSKPICYFWNIFDQVLVRPNLIEDIFNEDSLNIVTSIKNRTLLDKNGYVNKEISDHLPIEFELNNI